MSKDPFDTEEDMSTGTRIPAAEVNGLYGALIKTAAKKMVGRVPD